jgi:hypothetical protein
LSEKWEVDLTHVFNWLLTLDASTFRQVVAAIDLLEHEGPHLGRPFVDTIRGSNFSNMKELRPGSSGRTEVRILFAFDTERRAILLLGGDKSRAWARWYRINIPRADALFARHLERHRRHGL